MARCRIARLLLILLVLHHKLELASRRVHQHLLLPILLLLLHARGVPTFSRGLLLLLVVQLLPLLLPQVKLVVLLLLVFLIDEHQFGDLVLVGVWGQEGVVSLIIIRWKFALAVCQWHSLVHVVGLILIDHIDRSIFLFLFHFFFADLSCTYSTAQSLIPLLVFLVLGTEYEPLLWPVEVEILRTATLLKSHHWFWLIRMVAQATSLI